MGGNPCSRSAKESHVGAMITVRRVSLRKKFPVTILVETHIVSVNETHLVMDNRYSSCGNRSHSHWVGLSKRNFAHGIHASKFPGKKC